MDGSLEDHNGSECPAQADFDETPLMTISNGISQDERQKIAALRKLVKDDLTEYYDTDFNLLRWLQGHAQLDLVEIAKKLRHHLKARKSAWDFDNMHKKSRTHTIHNHWRYGITGESEVLENVIINIEQCGTTDYTGMLDCFSVSEVMKARLWDLEDMLKQVMDLEKRTGRQAWILYVMDVTGLEYNKKLYDLVTGSMRCLAEFMAEHYVEMIKFFVPINLPSFAVALYTVVRPLLPERTKNKVRLLSSSHWKDEILQFSKIESLPSIWNDDTHTFPAHVDPPQSYSKDWYYSSKGLKLPENIQEIDVPAGKHHIISLNLQQGDVVSWWVSGNRNFGFGFLKPRDEDDDDYMVMDQMVPLFPWMPGPIQVPIDETLEITEDGLYIFWISNERSWWWSVRVQLRIEVNSQVEETAAVAV